MNVSLSERYLKNSNMRTIENIVKDILLYDSKIDELQKRFAESGYKGGWPVDSDTDDIEGELHEFIAYRRSAISELRELDPVLASKYPPKTIEYGKSNGHYWFEKTKADEV